MIKHFLYRFLLMRFIANSCEARIPRSGERGAAVNCYVVTIDSDGFPYFMATEISGDRIDGMQWNGGSYCDHASLYIADLDAGNFRITHYYGLSEVIYESIYDAAWNYFTRLVYLRINVHRFLDSTFQYLFNKRKLVTKKRIELIQLMMEDQIDRTHNGITLSDLMVKLYSVRMFLHPTWETQEKRVQLYLDSLVASGDITLVNDEYVVGGAALNTIERYEEEERRHAEAVKLQRLIAAITILGVAFAAVQSGFIKLPTVLDLSVASTTAVVEKNTNCTFSAAPIDPPNAEGKKKP